MIESFLLYNGDFELHFNPGNHQYKIIRTKTGRSFKPDSVTRICGIIDKSAPLMGWAVNNTIDFIRAGIPSGIEHSESYLEEIYGLAKKESQRKKSDAAQRGTIVHEILGRTDGRDEQDLDKQLDESILRRVDLARTWLKENNVKLSSIERPIYSRRYRYSGRFDGVGEIEGKRTLFDWKTGKSVYPEFRLQTAAYQYAYEEELGEPIEQRVILHLTEEACIPHYYPRDKFRGDMNAFLGAQKLHQQIKRIEKEMKNK